MRIVYEKAQRQDAWPIVEAISSIERHTPQGSAFYEMPLEQLRIDWPEDKYDVMTVADGSLVAQRLRRVTLYIDKKIMFGLSTTSPESATVVSIA